MTAKTTSDANLRQRTAATSINLACIVLLAAGVEFFTTNLTETNRAAQTIIATKALFGLWILFWLGCAQVRSSPGLALMKLRVVSADDQSHPVNLTTALFRPLLHGAFLSTLIFPVHLLPPSIAPIQFLMVLIGALMLSANATPLWSGSNRRSLLDQWLHTRVIRRSRPGRRI